MEFEKKEGMAAPKRWTPPQNELLNLFHENQSDAYKDRDTLIFKDLIMNLYSDLSKYLYQISESQGLQKIQAVKVQKFKNPHVYFILQALKL